MENKNTQQQDTQEETARQEAIRRKIKISQVIRERIKKGDPKIFKMKAQNTTEKYPDEYYDLEIKCNKCNYKLDIQKTFEIQNALFNNLGNIRNWFKRGLKYGFICFKCHNILKREEEAIF